MFNLLRADVYTLNRSKVWWVLSGIITVLAFFLVFFPYLEKIGAFDTIETMDNTGLDELSSIQITVEALSQPDVFFSTLIFSALAAFFISSEYSNGTIKNVTSMGYRRVFIYLSKMSVFTVGGIILIMLFYVIPATFGALFFGVGEWPAKEILIDTGKILLLSLLYYVALAAIVTFFSFLCRGSGTALLTSFGFYLLVGTGFSFLGAQYTFWEKFNEYSVYHLFSTIGERVTQQGEMFHLIGVPIGTIIIFTTLGLILFQRKDIQ